MTCSVQGNQLNPGQSFALIAILNKTVSKSVEGQYLHPDGCHPAESCRPARRLQVVTYGYRHDLVA